MGPPNLPLPLQVREDLPAFGRNGVVGKDTGSSVVSLCQHGSVTSDHCSSLLETGKVGEGLTFPPTTSQKRAR